MAQYIKRIMGVLLLVGVVAALYFGITEEQVPPKISWGATELASGRWTQTEDAVVFAASLDAVSANEPMMLLQSQSRDYSVFVDDALVYTSSGIKTGLIHLFRLPQGKSLTIQFFCQEPQAAATIRQSVVYLGSSGAMYHMIVRENLYALLCGILFILFGISAIIAGIYMRFLHFGKIYSSIINLGVYMLLAGAWVPTDSMILLLVSQKSGFVALLSYLLFYASHIPLLRFTESVLPSRKKVLNLLECLYFVMLLLLIANYIGNFSIQKPLLFSEHLLMLLTIVLVLIFGYQEQRRQRSKTLGRVLAGYIVFAICSVAAILLFYVGNFQLYSFAYIIGIGGFILFLSDAAWWEVISQIRENANVEFYAQMAYLDRMTGMGNRTAFMEEEQKIARSSKPLGYILADVNCLKQVNDTLGHHQGDALIVQVAQCIRHAAEPCADCYRIGGDEFVVRMEGCKEEEVQRCMERIRAEIQAAAAQSQLHFSVALGCAWSDRDDCSPAELLRQADNAMYREKSRMKACQ